VENIIISKDKKDIDLKKLVKYISKESYWGKNTDRGAIVKSIENSLCYSVLFNNEFIGFARIITDYSTFKYLCDVFILPDYQDKGIGKKLMQFIIDDPEIKDGGFLLLAREAHNFYAKFGFLPADTNKELTDKLMYKKDKKKERS
jgi:GNAT superfamily N-acetyltransferase